LGAWAAISEEVEERNSMSGMEKSSSLVDRLLLSFIFVLSGCSKIAGWNQSTAFIASKGIPIVNVMLAGAVIVEVLGGLALLVGFRARIAAGVLFLFLIPTGDLPQFLGATGNGANG